MNDTHYDKSEAKKLGEIRMITWNGFTHLHRDLLDAGVIDHVEDMRSITPLADAKWAGTAMKRYEVLNIINNRDLLVKLYRKVSAFTSMRHAVLSAYLADNVHMQDKFSMLSVKSVYDALAGITPATYLKTLTTAMASIDAAFNEFKVEFSAAPDFITVEITNTTEPTLENDVPYVKCPAAETADDGGYKLHTSMTEPSVTEDPPSVRLAFKPYEQRVVEFGSSEMPLNIYGPEDAYKPFPGIDEEILDMRDPNVKDRLKQFHVGVPTGHTWQFASVNPSESKLVKEPTSHLTTEQMQSPTKIALHALFLNLRAINKLEEYLNHPDENIRDLVSHDINELVQRAVDGDSTAVDQRILWIENEVRAANERAAAAQEKKNSFLQVVHAPKSIVVYYNKQGTLTPVSAILKKAGLAQGEDFNVTLMPSEGKAVDSLGRKWTMEDATITVDGQVRTVSLLLHRLPE